MLKTQFRTAKILQKCEKSRLNRTSGSHDVIHTKCDHTTFNSIIPTKNEIKHNVISFREIKERGKKSLKNIKNL